MRRHPALALSFFLFVSSALFSGLLAAQENPNRPPWAQKQKPAGDKSAPAAKTPETANQEPDRSTIRVKVELVNVLVSVLDEHNRPAPDLPQDAFQLTDEGVPQTIAVFEKDTHQPLDLALMIDASLSAQLDMPSERAAASHFIERVLRPGDRLAVYGFDENVTQISGFTDNVPALQNAVHSIPPGAGTSIYDALFLGSRALERRASDRRRVIVLITDGGETTSHSDFDTARNAAVKAGALLYTILIRPVKNESGRNTAGEHALQTITDMTGGAMFFPVQPQDLDAIFDQIDRELRTQYRLGYYPTPKGPPDTYRTIEVKVRGSYSVRHRKTYYTGRQ
jgi:Ca-activated chloride channel family protein